jgi:hypothetical protein
VGFTSKLPDATFQEAILAPDHRENRPPKI